jgi:hypothetical protein
MENPTEMGANRKVHMVYLYDNYNTRIIWINFSIFFNYVVVRNETKRNQRNENEIKRNQRKQNEINENKTK